MNKDVVLGIDIGTSAVKVMAINKEGDIVAESERGYSRIERNNLVEQDPHSWWECLKAACKDLKCDFTKINCIGLSGQLNGLVPMSKDGYPLGNAIIWLDQRASEEADFLRKNYLLEIERGTYNHPTSINNLSKIFWLKKSNSQLFDKTYKFLGVKDYIIFKLTGKYVSDVTDASAGLMLDIKNRNWFYPFLEKVIGMNPNQLPELHESTDIVGEVSKVAADEIGFPKGIPVVAGAGDVSSLALGTGVIKKEAACATIGTAGHVAAYLEELPKEINEKLWTLCHAIPGKYLWHGLVMTAGQCLSWFVDLFKSIEIDKKIYHNLGFNYFIKGAEEVPPGSRGLIFLPFLNGEATPGQDPFARGAFLGLKSSTSLFSMVRAVLEGVTYNFREAFELLDESGEIVIHKVFVGEGGSKSSLWPQIMADVLQKEIISLTVLNSSALGAAMLAGVGSGFWSDFQEASDKVCFAKESYWPKVANVSAYEKYYKLYLKAKNNLKNFNEELFDISKE